MKACPVCGANAFDDAELCFGCLHRFDAAAQGGGLGGGCPPPEPSKGRPGAGAPRSFRPGLSAIPEPGAFPGAAPHAPSAEPAGAAQPAPRVPVAAPPPPPAAAFAAAQAAPALRQACAAALEREPTAMAAAFAPCTAPEGFTLRFELPGCAAVLEPRPDSPGSGKRSCELLAGSDAPARSAPCDLVVRFRAESRERGVERRLASLRGSHVRDRAPGKADAPKIGERP